VLLVLVKKGSERMETKANFVLIGAFTVLGILGVLGLFVWFAKVEIDQQYAQYDILFDTVSGLGLAGDVRYNGLSVGRVTDLTLDQADPSKVRVRIEVRAETPIKTDTVAQLNAQGVTGVSFVSLSGGSPGSPLLRDVGEPGAVPLIQSERSIVQALTEDAPDLIAEAVAALKEARSFLGEENQTAVSSLLRNLERASGQLDQALADFSDISKTVSEGTAQISKFTRRLDNIGNAVETTLKSANKTLEVARSAIVNAETTLTAATTALTTAETTFGDADTFIKERVPVIADDLSSAIRSIDTATNDLRAQIDDLSKRFGGSADQATARLTELQTTIAALDATLADARASFTAVESASTNFQGLIDGEGTALVADARATLKTVQETIAGLDKTLKEDIPAIVTDVRTAVTSATGVINQVSTDVSAFTKRLEPLTVSGEATLQAATETLQNANRTMANLDKALGTSEETLDAAKGAFVKAEGIMDSDLGPAIADIRAAASQFDATMAAVSKDIPGLTEDLRAAAGKALDVIDGIDETVSASAPPIRTFAQNGLPEITKFAREAQTLVIELEKLTKKLERDPARFFFGNNASEFRR
jgi:phospholipid/cholesterol/gamma-HCH transport system substrate-binding protein